MKLVRFKDVFVTSSEVIFVDQNVLKLRAFIDILMTSLEVILGYSLRAETSCFTHDITVLGLFLCRDSS